MLYSFADEAGNFDFSPAGSRYFIVTAIVLNDLQLATQLITLRHVLALKQLELRDEGFHAAEDKQAVRDEVFTVLAGIKDLHIHAVVMDKRKTIPRIAQDDAYFYQLGWYYLFKSLYWKYLQNTKEELFVSAATLGTKKKRSMFLQALHNTAEQQCPGRTHRAFWTAASHPCIQAADYCSWAIQRQYEMSDNRSFVLIQNQIVNIFEPFRRGSRNYY